MPSGLCHRDYSTGGLQPFGHHDRYRAVRRTYLGLPGHCRYTVPAGERLSLRSAGSGLVLPEQTGSGSGVLDRQISQACGACYNLARGALWRRSRWLATPWHAWQFRLEQVL